MSEQVCCPRCGSPEPAGRGHGEAWGPRLGQDGPIDSLYAEVRRIRELAEDGDDAARRIAELTHEVQELRATVARLRATAATAPARSR